MGIARKIANNSLPQFAGKLINSALGFSVFVLLARYLGVSDYGKYTSVLVLVSFLVLFANLGLNTIAIRETQNKI